MVPRQTNSSYKLTVTDSAKAKFLSHNRSLKMTCNPRVCPLKNDDNMYTIYDNSCFEETEGDSRDKQHVVLSVISEADISKQGLSMNNTCSASHEDSQGQNNTAPTDTFVARSKVRGISKAKLVLVVSILLTEMAERLAFYSLSANMVLFSTSRLGFTSIEGTTISLIFSAFSNLFPVLGGYISDTKMGRFTTIWSSFVVNLIGLLAIQCASIDFQQWFGSGLEQASQRCFYLIGALLVTLGTGGVKANISPFGAEQVESLGSEVVESFFHWFYWAINIGALLAYSGVAYLQQNVSFTWGLFIPLATTLLALCVFIAPKKFYIRSNPQGSALATAFKVIHQGCKKSSGSPKAKDHEMFLRARERFGGDFDEATVNGVAGVVSVLPFCALVIMYYALYSQTTSTFFVQSEHMDIRVGDTKIPAAMLNTTGNIVILLLVPVIDRLFYPCMRKIGLPLSHLKRIGIGMVLSAVAMIVAGVVELHRKDVIEEEGPHVQILANENFTASAASVFLQVPQFGLIGASEIFTSVTCLEFAYTQAPHSFQGVLTGLFLAAWGLGNCLSVGIMLMVEKATESDPWYGSQINDVKMENYMFLLAGLMAVNLVAFRAVSWLFKYQDQDREDNPLQPSTSPSSSSSSPLPSSYQHEQRTDIDVTDEYAMTKIDLRLSTNPTKNGTVNSIYIETL